MTAVHTAADPVRVADVVFNHDHWSVPQAIIRAAFHPSARVAVKACHASSKTFALADCVLIALLLGGDVITTAPTWEQVQTVLWGQIRRTIMESRIPLREWGQVNLTEITMATGERAIGLSTNEGVRFQGWHARPGAFLLIIVDEALGVRPDIYAAIEGIAAGGDVRIVLAGNPTAPGGYFYDVFQAEPSHWSRFTIDAFETPNLDGVSLEQLLAMSDAALDDNPRPYLVSRRWVRDKYFEWGEDHPEWQGRVRGQFPQNSDQALIWQSWIQHAKTRAAHYDPNGGPLVAGVDVAGPGEAETVVCVRQGEHLLAVQAWTQPDPRGAVVAMLREHQGCGLARVVVDSAGIGHYFAQHLRDHLDGVAVDACNVGEAPSSDDRAARFANLKAELYWALREAFHDGAIAGVADPLLAQQLASVRYDHDLRGRVRIETKEQAAKRGIASPDRAEALMLSFAPVRAEQRVAEALARQAEPRSHVRAAPIDPFLRATQDRRRRLRR